MEKEEINFINDVEIRFIIEKWLKRRGLESKYKGFDIMVDILAYVKLNELSPKVTLFNDKVLTDYIVDKHKIKAKSIQRSLRYVTTVKNTDYIKPIELLRLAYTTLDLSDTEAYKNYKILKYGF